MASGFAMVGSAVAGLEALGLVAVSLAVVRFKQHWVHHTDAAEITGVTKTAGSNAAKPNVGKATGLSMSFLADVTINQPKNKCTIICILAFCYSVFVNVK